MNRKNIYIYLILSLVFLQTSCIKDLTELNKDPNNSTEVDTELLFKYAVKRGNGDYLTSSHLEYNGLQQWVMYMATRGGVESGNEYPSPAGGDGFWNSSYIDAMNNAQVVIRLTDGDSELSNLNAAALIWKVFIMHRITDLWGDTPYSEALQGNPDIEFTPTYDTQEAIYSQMLSQLETAVNSIDASKPFVSESADLIYGGEIENWKRFANALRFRLAMRISSINASLSESTIRELQSEILIENESQTASFLYNSVYNKPLYEATVIRYQEGAQYINPSKFLVDLLVNTNDPRIKNILKKTTLSDTYPFIDEYRGVPNLLPYNSEEWENYNLDAALGDPLGEWGDVSRVGQWFLNNDRPVQLLGYSEMCFLKAEAALKGWWTADAGDLFKEGIASHIAYMNEYSTEVNITDIEILNYSNQFQDIDLADVITQKYILFTYENVFEAYADYRRTGYPVLLDYFEEGINLDIFPRRLRYPYSEYTLNRDNYLQAVENQGSDTQLTRVWWDIER
ncbi:MULTISPECIES: SusD/RagB family nutrient-binding outer membrane lipoprotein [unclassified Lentimicrobium]|uniref:SusD/RagB family nutrient-binding outer membrane lipoprotein n=1 Tax=unclassified Lentimicrobium TaxID=2677434 RepID=UPI001552F47B|nr:MULTISPECIES: SusD/RagB family nutrient-binding outer membrane lipoprotein [unclassified Lentimicrobium]NPD45057.1 SusD/RagB family nutrient-binding outer membrane lipoprotein [Lentimicrobium sp. S6]NPD84545.1 SusD/RagB family nutrient-binding outer membrane lipoprotein [Lentimicrobium sp. L6]